MEVAEFETHERLEATHWWFEGRRRCIAAVLDAHLTPRPQHDILDVGCGTGGMFPMLQRYGRVSGAEYAEDARERARRLFPDVEVAPCALPDELPDGTYSLVTAFDVLEHLDDAVASARALASRLIPGGQLVVTVPAFSFLWSAHDVWVHHKRRYTRGLLRAHLEGAGLKVTYDSYFNSALFPAVAAARFAQRLLRRGVSETGESNLAPVAAPLNRLLTGIFGSERHLLGRARLPVGVSLIAVAEAG